MGKLNVKIKPPTMNMYRQYFFFIDLLFSYNIKIKVE